MEYYCMQFRRQAFPVVTKYSWIGSIVEHGRRQDFGGNAVAEGKVRKILPFDTNNNWITMLNCIVCKVCECTFLLKTAVNYKFYS